MRFKYDQETRDRVVRMFQERRREAPDEPRSAWYRHLQELTAIPADTMRGWEDKARVDTGEKAGLKTAERDEIKALKKELAELKRANDTLKTASAYFAAAELDRRLK